MKQVKLMAVALLLVVLVAMPAFAASQLVIAAGGNIAYEVLGTNRTLTLNDASQPVKIVLGNALSSGDAVSLVLSGGAQFVSGASYYLCANNSAGVITTPIATGISATSTTLGLGGLSTTDVPLIGAGANVWVSTSSTCSNATTGGAFSFMVPASTPVGTITLSGNAAAFGALKTIIAANNLATISRQIGTTLTAATLVGIDYINSPANGTTLVGVTSSGTSNIVGGGKAITVTNDTAIPNSLTTYSGALNQVVTLTDGYGSWAGISRFYAVAGADPLCTGTVVASANVPTSGNLTLTIPIASANFAAAANIALCANVAGNVVIPGRSIFGAYSYVVTAGTGILAPSGGGSATTVLQTWVPNGYQAFNPYMYVGTSQDTLDVFCRFYNSSTQTAQVFVDVYPADGSAAMRQTLASIPSNTAATYWGSTIGTNASLAVGTSYAALFTITAPPGQINGVSFFKRSTGERQLPLYKSVRAADNYLSE